MTEINEYFPTFHMTKAAAWSGRWWLLDVETSGLDRQENDIIALRLACMEGYQVTEERELLTRPRRPLRPWAEKLTGISNQSLDQAASLDEAIGQLEALDAPLLFLDRDFTLPFLQAAYQRCGREFSKPCLLLDRLAALLLDCSPRQKTERFLEQLPPPDDLCGTPPREPGLNALYRLSLSVFHALAETRHIQNTAQLADFYGQENGYEYTGHPDLRP